MNPFLSTLLHIAELVAIILVVWLISYLFDIGSEPVQAVLLVVLASLAKLARSTDNVPFGVGDYVNKL